MAGMEQEFPEEESHFIMQNDIKVEDVRDEEEARPSKPDAVSFPQEAKHRNIKNKQVRNQLYLKAKREAKKRSMPIILHVDTAVDAGVKNNVEQVEIIKRKQMTEYEEKIFELNKKKIQLSMKHMQELHDLHMTQEREIHAQKMRIMRLAKKAVKAKQRADGVPKKVPHTLDSLREKDETIVEDITTEDNAVIKADLDNDELSSYYQNEYEPKVLITYSDNPTKKTRIFGRELTRIIPNSWSFYRNRSGVKKIVTSAINEKYTDVIVVNENRREPNGLLLIHLPDGPTAHFKLSNVRITTEMRRNYRHITQHRPEVVLNQFATRLGIGVGRMLGALFHYNPEFQGQRCVTFHNQRDFIFFRHYKYNFDNEGKRTTLKELGPRFTLKLKSLQKGTFDSKYGQYEWIIDGKRHKMETSRRKFFL